MSRYFVRREIPRSDHDVKTAAWLSQYGLPSRKRAQGKLGLMGPEIRPIQVWRSRDAR